MEEAWELSLDELRLRVRIVRRQKAAQDAHLLNLMAVAGGATRGKEGFTAYQRLLAELNKRANAHGNDDP